MQDPDPLRSRRAPLLQHSRCHACVLISAVTADLQGYRKLPLEGLLGIGTTARVVATRGIRTHFLSLPQAHSCHWQPRCLRKRAWRRR